MQRKRTYGVLLCGVALTASAVNYPTYRPAGNFTPVEYRSVIENGTPMLEMRSTSQYGEQLEQDWGLYNPFTDEYESPERASGGGARKAPPIGGIGAVFQRFLNTLPVKEVVDDVSIYDKELAKSYWGASSDMPTGATWETFCIWFEAQDGIAWYIPDVPLGDGLWLLLLCALMYAGARSYYRYRSVVKSVCGRKSRLSIATSSLLHRYFSIG